MITKSTEKLLQHAVAIEQEEAQAVGALGFIARSLVLAALPHTRPTDNQFVRKNGNFTLTMWCPQEIGLPYGSVPRILLAWISTEAVRTQSRTLVLGHSLAMFMAKLGLGRTGGDRGDITRLRDQMRRLFSTTIVCDYHDPQRQAGVGCRITNTYLYWTSQSSNQTGRWQSTVTLDEYFYREIVGAPVPIDLRALSALRRSPLAIDLYNWLTYRYSYLTKPTLIRWESLELQFGSRYTRLRDFKSALQTELKKVSVVYPSANVSVTDAGLKLCPSPTHISPE